MIKCRKCGTNVDLIKNKSKREGLESICKSGSKLNRESEHSKCVYRDWYNKNSQKVISKSIENRDKRRVNPKKQLLSNEQKAINRKISAMKNKQRRKSDPLLNLTDVIGNLIRGSIRKNGYVKNNRTEIIIGCSYVDFKIYLESKFQEGMSWDNYGDWHIDHIIPISWAKSEYQVYELNNYKNLQPLWKEDNLKKGNILNRRNNYYEDEEVLRRNLEQMTIEEFKNNNNNNEVSKDI